MPRDFFAAYAQQQAERMAKTPLDGAPWAALTQAYTQTCAQPVHGDLPGWLSVLRATAALRPSVVDLDRDALRIGTAADLAAFGGTDALVGQLRQLHPWRKGPFELFGVPIDTEWRSDWKWQRIAPHLSPLAGRTVLDVGCGSGYHVWRLAGAGAAAVLGIEPMWLYVLQFALLQQWLVHAGQAPAASVLPLTLEQVPDLPQTFDTILSMGVLYHRRDPLQHLMTLKRLLKPGGELLLETLVVEGGVDTVLVPEDRYCRMRNVWFLPSVAQLIRWCERLGFRAVRCVDLNWTSVQEQRRTDWMTFDSLAESLDPHQPRRTVEGLPAPLRAALLMQAP